MKPNEVIKQTAINALEETVDAFVSSVKSQYAKQQKPIDMALNIKIDVTYADENWEITGKHEFTEKEKHSETLETVKFNERDVDLFNGDENE